MLKNNINKRFYIFLLFGLLYIVMPVHFVERYQIIITFYHNLLKIVIEIMSIYSFKKISKIDTFSSENFMICDDYF